MNMRPRKFLFLVTPAAAAAPGLGQAEAPAGRSTKGTGSVPQFSGVWAPPVHPRLRAPCLGPDLADEPIAARHHDPQPPACWRLHQPDPDARGDGYREEARRNSRYRLSDPS